MAPSHDLFLYFQGDLRIRKHWFLNGMHYANTLRAWLDLMDAKKRELWPVFEDTYGRGAEAGGLGAVVWWHRWRIFYIACEELFGFNGGEEWGVSHYLFQKPAAS